MNGNQRIRVRLQGYEYKPLDAAASEIVQTVRRSGGSIIGPVPLPRRIQKYTVQRSTFCDKKSREQFEIRTYKRVLYIVDPTPQTLDELGKLELSSGLGVEIQVQ